MHQPLIHKMMFLNDILHTMTSETSENIFSADIKVSKFRLHGCNMYSGADLEEGGGGDWVRTFSLSRKIKRLK